MAVGIEGTNQDIRAELESIRNRLLKPSRVLDIIHDESHPDYKNTFLSSPSCFGFIKHSPLDQNSQTSNIWAKPLFPHFKSYPVKGEIVYLLEGPDNDLFSSNISTYYIPLTSVYNHPHQNILPNTQNTTDDPLKGTNTFNVRFDIRPLKPFEGDVIVEGRYGNSIRLGSSNFKNNVGFNPWSTNIESNSQPITILRNGQKQENFVGLYPILEDVNNDLSSIYLTSNQKINIKAPGTLLQQSYFNTRTSSKKSTQPSNLSNFNKPQIIIKSDRIVLNAQEDEIYLFAKKSLGFHTAGSINIDANDQFVINSPEIYLGLNSNEPILKGNITGEYLKQMLDVLIDTIGVLISDYTLISGAPGDKTGVYSENIKSFKPTIDRIEFLKTIVDRNLNGMKSERNFTQ